MMKWKRRKGKGVKTKNDKRAREKMKENHKREELGQNHTF